MNRKYSTILFDFDGTIANTDEVIVQSFYALYKLYGVKPKTPEEIYYFSGPPIIESLRKEFPNVNEEEIFKKFCEISKDMYAPYIQRYEGCNKLLRELKNQGYRLGVVTNKVHSLTEYCIHLLDMDGIFDTVVGSTDVVNKKPHQEPLLKAIANLGETDISKALYVGDNDLDYECARNAHIDCMLVTWGPRKQNPDLKPEYKLDSFDTFLEVIEHE